MAKTEILKAEDVAEIMGTSVQALRNAIHRKQDGVTFPPSIVLGRRRRWLRSAVYAWLRSKARASTHLFPRAREGASHSPPQKEDLNMSRLKVRAGDVFADSEGLEVTVVEIDADEDRVLFEDENGEQGVMSLEDMLDEIRSGELQKLDPEEAGNG